MFNTDSTAQSANRDDSAALIAAAAAAVSPVSELNTSNREALCRSATVVHVQRNDELRPDNAQRWLMYLVEGNLILYNGREEVGNIAARTPEAQQPLFLDKTVYQSARTSAMAKIVRFGREQMDILLREQQKNAIHVLDVDVSERDNAVFDSIIADFAANRVRLASTDWSAEQILAKLGQLGGIPELAGIIQSDPGLAIHVIHAANRSDGSTGEPIQTIRGAISRLGVDTTKRLLTDQLQAGRLKPANAHLEKRFRRYYQRAILSSAIVHVLSQQVPELKSDVATMVALFNDIGELLVLSHANAQAERFGKAADLAATIDTLRTVCGGWLLAVWDLPAHFIDSAHIARDWYRNHNGEITYADLVTAALLIIQAEMPDSEHSSIPSADNLLLARRLQQAGIDLKSPSEIVRAATGKIVELQTLLKAS